MVRISQILLSPEVKLGIELGNVGAYFARCSLVSHGSDLMAAVFHPGRNMPAEISTVTAVADVAHGETYGRACLAVAEASGCFTDIRDLVLLVSAVKLVVYVFAHGGGFPSIRMLGWVVCRVYCGLVILDPCFVTAYLGMRVRVGALREGVCREGENESLCDARETVCVCVCRECK